MSLFEEFCKELFLRAQKRDRNLPDVIDAMLAEVPESERQLRASLHSAKHTALFTAPEVMGKVWGRVSESLEQHFGEAPAQPWQRAVATIFTGRAA